jgi:hypothetical protein
MGRQWGTGSVKEEGCLVSFQLRSGGSLLTYVGSRTGLELYIEEVDMDSAVNRDLSLGDKIEASEFGSAKSR